MSFLSRFSILTKILAIIALIGAVMVGGTWFATSSMKSIDDSYSKYLEKDAVAWVTAPRIARNTYELRFLLNRILVETDVEERKKIEANINNVYEEFAKLTKQVKDLSAEHAPAVDVMIGKMNKMREIAGPMVKAALAQQDDKAKELLKNERSGFVDLSKDAAALRDAIDKSIKKGSDELTGETNAAIRMVYIVMGSGLVLGVGFAFVIAMFGISKPLGTLVGLLLRMAKGESVEMIGTRPPGPSMKSR